FCAVALVLSLLGGGGLVSQSGSRKFTFTNEKGADFIGPFRIGRGSMLSLRRSAPRSSLFFLEFSLAPCSGDVCDAPVARTTERCGPKGGLRAHLCPPDASTSQFYVVVRPAVPFDDVVNVRVSYRVTFALMRYFARR